MAKVDLGVMANEEVLCIPQSSSIIGTSLSDCLVSYLGHLLGKVRVLPLYRGAVRIFYSPKSNEQLRNRSAMWGLEDNTACYGQEKKKLWVNIAIRHVSLCLTHHRSSNPLWKNKKIYIYIYITKCCGHSSSMYIPHYGYITVVCFFLRHINHFGVI